MASRIDSATSTAPVRGTPVTLVARLTGAPEAPTRSAYRRPARETHWKLRQLRIIVSANQIQHRIEQRRRFRADQHHRRAALRRP